MSTYTKLHMTGEGAYLKLYSLPSKQLLTKAWSPRGYDRAPLVIETGVFDEGDMHLVLPMTLVGEGEPGDEFPFAFRQFLILLADLGWWPIDFGEGNDTHVVLWMAKTNPSDAIRSAMHFLEKGAV